MSYYIDAINVGNALQNYIWMLVDTQQKHAVAIDPTHAGQVLAYCQQHQLQLTQIWITHKHHDHIAGLVELRAKTHAQIYAPLIEQDSIKFCDHYLQDDSHFYFSQLKIDVIGTPGHTLGHICYFIDAQDALFSGDTLFAMGCGRIFEGSYEQMYQSLKRLAALPAYTKIYCSHEYTESNARFALSIEPDNHQLQARYTAIKEMRQQLQCTLPSTIALELQTNPFLRCDSLSAFKKARQLKDQF